MFVSPKSATCKFNGNAIKFSPFEDYSIAVATAQYFGIVGNGQQCIYHIRSWDEITLVHAFDTQHGINDCAWNEMNQFQIVSGCSDGSIKLFDTNVAPKFPIQNYHEHTQDVSSVSWNLCSKDSFASASWDGTIKIWRPEMKNSLHTLYGHGDSVYEAVYHPRNGNVIVSCSGDRSIRCWDLQQSNQAMITIPNAHGHDVLSVDWNKYDPYQIVSGAADRSIKIWDTRNMSIAVNTLYGHSYAVKKVRSSPFHPHEVASVSYDMSVCFWNTKIGAHALFSRSHHHKEFVLGLDYSCFHDNLVASCSWDKTIAVWNISTPPTSVR